MNEKLSAIAKMIDHSLLHPSLTDKEIKQGCELAKKLGVASVCIKPYAVSLAAEILKGSDVKVGTVVGFPHGNSTIEIKVREAELACGDGATELDMVVNIGKVLSEDWDYIEKEIRRIYEATRKHNAILKVIFENDFLYHDKFKIKLCEVCEMIKVDFVKTSTGFGYVKGSDNKYCSKGATDSDLKLMRENCSSDIKIKAAGRIRTLDDLLRVKSLGVKRVGTSDPQAILSEAWERGYN